MTLKLAETSVVKSRPSVQYGANFYYYYSVRVLKTLYRLVTEGGMHLLLYIRSCVTGVLLIYLLASCPYVEFGSV